MPEAKDILDEFQNYMYEQWFKERIPADALAFVNLYISKFRKENKPKDGEDKQ